MKTLSIGQQVEFQPYLAGKGWQARDVHVFQGGLEASDYEALVLRKNPFTPQGPVRDPAKFAGRRDSFRNAVDALYNNKYILVSGPRGIGKSSVSYQLFYLDSGRDCSA